jgi:hypothetical protein
LREGAGRPPGGGCVVPVPQPGTRQKRQARAGRRGAELAAQSEKGQVNRSVSLGQATPDHRSKLGGGSDRGTGCGEINKAVHKRAGGHPHPATRPARALPQRPRVPPAAAPGRAGLPGPPAAGPAPRACKAWEVPGRPRPPGCSAVRSPRSSPRPATSSSAGRAAPARTARLPAAAAVALPAHRRGPRPRSAPTDRPPARPGSVRAHLARLPSLSGTLRSRTRPRPQPGPDSPPGKGAD